MLVNQGSILTFDRSFEAFFCSFMHQRTVGIHRDFPWRFFGRRLDELLTHLENSRALLIPFLMLTFRREMKQLRARSSLQPVSNIACDDSIHSFFKFDDITPHVLLLADFIQNMYRLSNQEWPEQWTQSFKIFSVEQGNGDDCRIFTILNALIVSLDIDRPPKVPRTLVSNVYRAHLALCLLDSDTNFLL